MNRSIVFALAALAGFPTLASAAPALGRYSDRGIIVVGGREAIVAKKGIRPASSRLQLGSESALNPQPLPPKTALRTQLGAKIALNSQPLPPKTKALTRFSGSHR